MAYKELTAQNFSEAIYAMEGISKKTVEEHIKLYQGYIKKYNEVNKLLSELAEEDYTGANQVYSRIRALKVDITFAWGGVVNHELYFSHLGGKGGEPQGELKEQIVKDFGSWEAWVKDFKATGVAARGWVWLGYSHAEERLFNYLGDAQNTYPVWGVTPILALDTYEHAYFIDYGTARAAYIDAFFKNLNWSVVEENFIKAKEGSGCVCGHGCC